MRVLFAINEAAPLYKLGGLGDVGGGLPKHLTSQGIDVRLVMPHHADLTTPTDSVTQSQFTLNYCHETLNISVSLCLLPGSNVPVYLFSEPKYLSTRTDAFDRDVEKYLVFTLAVNQWLTFQTWQPHLLHCHDWHTALIPVVNQHLSQKIYPSLLTIHNLGYQGRSRVPIIKNLGLKATDCQILSWDGGDGEFNLLMEGIIHAHHISTVSKNYALEILTQEYGSNLDPILLTKASRLQGIINGIDTTTFNPETDMHLSSHFSLANALEGKALNRQEICNVYQLDPQLPLIGFIGRVDPQQKGIDLLLEYLYRSVDLPPHNFIFLGTGDPSFETKLHEAEKISPRIKIITRFDEPLAHKLYAAAHFLLIPSRYEPCGLIQLIAMRYGTIPIAHATGGLVDTISHNQDGFLFKPLNLIKLLESVNLALEQLETDAYLKLVSAAMMKDSSWQKPTAEYIKLYQKLISN